MREITLDIDRPFFQFMNNEHAGNMLEKISHVPWVTARFIRRSSNGNTHLKLVMASDVGLLDSLCIRAYLGDDEKRIAQDLRRYFHGRIEGKTGRLFDEKYADGILHRAGDWVPF